MAGPAPDVDLDPDPRAAPANPWHALWAMLVGFFMILVDSTIVAVANPSIMDALEITDYDTVIWVTSAYLLAYAVPLLLAGRLGDRFGPKNLYIAGLAVFTASSLWCGMAGSIDMLIAARVAQGLGAALLTPQTLSTITRIFPPERRGVAMSLWGATAGVATLVGPLAGGVLVGHLGWEWIFFVNVPIGVVGLALAVWLIPALPNREHRFDVVGVVLSGLGMFLVVFGLQEGQSHHWAAWIWAVIVAGIGFFTAFVYWQSINRHEPLIPLHIFADRDFSLSNLAVAVIGFVVTAMMLPVMFYAQVVCGLSPTRSALLIAPMAIASGVLAPFVGRLTDRAHPRPILGFGFSVLAIALTWLSIDMTPATPIWRLVVPLTAMGVGMAFIWAPLATTATRNLPPHLAGAGSGVYNATRQVGSVLGSAGMAAFMASRIGAEMPAAPSDASPADLAVLSLPSFLHEPFAAALSQSMLLPAFVALFGIVAALFVIGGLSGRRVADEEITDRIPVYDDGYDDDDYLEYVVEPPSLQVPNRVHYSAEVDDETEVIVWDPPVPQPEPARIEPPVGPTRFTHNGFHVDGARHFSALDSLLAEAAAGSRHRLTDPAEPRRARHHRDEGDDAPSSGRHSRPD
ncbi:MFS transporter [Mycobacterium sp. shizuoka-1]|uniref:MFS transporter n=1 Tax=Mycobacterium sp. shizuoka-1 TaxID=2039281 RepID=UPI000C05F7BA|nr:MFS transporter [Mycobacterium sp. shizuoka-1]GAY16128.1 MFS transporter [Mycobacterium sp. shizuoka-1]